jgi:DNA-binding SARP family transcriptional activator
MIELATLGGALIRRDGSEFTGLSAHKQKIALLSYLAVEGPVPRECLVTVFWPDREQEKASHSLSQALYALKREVGKEIVGVAGEVIDLMSESVSVDIREMQAAGQKECWEGVVGLYRGAFLEGFHLPKVPAFDEWQTRTRAWVWSMARKAFGKVIGSRAAAGDVAGALDIAWRWARLEPLEDEAQHALIALLAMHGDRVVALEQYDAFRARMVAEFEVEPLQNTVALVEGIRAGVRPTSPLIDEAPLESVESRPGVAPMSGTAPEVAAVVPQTEADVEQLLREELGPSLEIIRKLAEGTTSTVYLAHEPAYRRYVAVKVFLPKLAPDRRARLRFGREVLAIGSLTHPNVVGLYWGGALSNGLPYFVMQYVPGPSMAHKLKTQGRLQVSDARKVLAGIAWALAAAHRRAIVHRDVQPGNVLCDEDTQGCLLVDFGIASILATAEERPVSITESGELVGDPAWMSPEQVKAEEVTGRSDVYSLGLLGYALLAEEGPYTVKSRADWYAAHVKHEPRRLSQLRPEVDPDLDDLLLECLAKDPRDRPSAARVAERLTSPVQERRLAPSWLQRLIERRVPHYVGVYLAAGFGLFELTDIAIGWQTLPRYAMPLYLASYFLGVPVVSIVTWFHGKKGPQKAEKVELVLLGAALLLWVVVGAAILSLF